MTLSKPYSPEEDAEIARLWADPTLSATAIAIRLGRTKNMVCGRINRLGLPQRGSPIGKGVTAARAEKPKRVTRKPMAAQVQRAPEPVFLAPSSRQCQWIEGSGPPWRFCDAPTQAKSSWCPAHHARCFVRVVRFTPQPPFAAQPQETT